MNNQTQEALKMAIGLCEKSIKGLEGDENSGLCSVNDEGIFGDALREYYKLLQACKEALAEAEKQEPVAWMHYNTYELIYHDVWEELLEGKDDWYPLDYYVNSQLHRVVRNHVEDLRKCIPALNEYPQMKNTAVEVGKAVNELEEALYTHPATWQSLSDREIMLIISNLDNRITRQPTLLEQAIARAIEQALKEKNHG